MRHRLRSDRGANLVEFALIMPFLLLLVLGIVEFGYFMGERNEIKHGAHEGARLAAVDAPNIITGACDAMNLPGTAGASITLSGAGDIGDAASIAVTTNVSSLSGVPWIEVFLPATLTTTADFRLEQVSSWSNTTQSC